MNIKTNLHFGPAALIMNQVQDATIQNTFCNNGAGKGLFCQSACGIKRENPSWCGNTSYKCLNFNLTGELVALWNCIRYSWDETSDEMYYGCYFDELEKPFCQAACPLKFGNDYRWLEKMFAKTIAIENFLLRTSKNFGIAVVTIGALLVMILILAVI